MTGPGSYGTCVAICGSSEKSSPAPMLIANFTERHAATPSYLAPVRAAPVLTLLHRRALVLGYAWGYGLGAPRRLERVRGRSRRCLRSLGDMRFAPRHLVRVRLGMEVLGVPSLTISERRGKVSFHGRLLPLTAADFRTLSLALNRIKRLRDDTAGGSGTMSARAPRGVARELFGA